MFSCSEIGCLISGIKVFFTAHFVWKSLLHEWKAGMLAKPKDTNRWFIWPCRPVAGLISAVVVTWNCSAVFERFYLLMVSTTAYHLVISSEMGKCFLALILQNILFLILQELSQLLCFHHVESYSPPLSLSLRVLKWAGNRTVFLWGSWGWDVTVINTS